VSFYSLSGFFNDLSHDSCSKFCQEQHWNRHKPICDISHDLTKIRYNPEYVREDYRRMYQENGKISFGEIMAWVKEKAAEIPTLQKEK
jgi:hypothetical protein